ncbi:MAG: glycosyltransferase family 4 protein [Pseudomonadota bacterium]
MIAIISPQFYGVHGIARYLDSFLANLPENHPTIYVITGDEYKVERHYKGVEIIDIPLNANRFSLLSWMLKARKIITQLHAEKKISVINLHIPPLIPGLLLPKHIPLILTAHTTYIGMSGLFYKKNYFVSQWSRLEVRVKRMMEYLIFQRAEKIIALTEQGKQEVLTYGFKKPIAVIPNGVDTALFIPDSTVAKEYDVMFCGRIERRKGSRAMVEVCQQLVVQKPGIRILIVGYGDDDAWVNTQLAANPNIKLTGKAKFAEMQSYYQRSQLYASTSYYEGLPGTCLEAMAMGLPAVVWDFLFYHELVIHDKTGMLVAPNQIDEMVSAIFLQLKKLESDELIPNNQRIHIQKNYDWGNLSKQVLAQICSSH